MNKPSESDAQETPQADVMSQDEFEKEFSEESQAGDENVLGSQDEESGDSEAQEIFFTKEEVEELVGREIKNKQDFSKHYTNLKSFVGKKEEKVRPQASKPKVGNEVMEKLTKIEFLGDNPEAKKYYEEFIKPMAAGKGISLEAAYESLKPYISATESQEKEKEIGVESKNRLEPAKSKQLQSLMQRARSGDRLAQEQYTREVINKKAGF